MKNIRITIEEYFTGIGEFSFKRPWWAIAISLSVTFFLFFQLQHLSFESAAESLLGEDDPAVVSFNQLKTDFGRNDDFIISISHKNLFNPSILVDIEQLHKTLEERVPYVGRVNSLFSVRHIYGLEDELIIESFLEDITVSNSELQALKQKAIQHRLYRDAYISRDGQTTNIYIRPAAFYQQPSASSDSYKTEVVGDLQLNEMLVVIREVAAEFPTLQDGLHISGMPTVNNELLELMLKDMFSFVAISLLIIAIMLFIIFHTWLAVILPLLVMVCTLISTMGFMGFMGQPIHLPTVIIPSFILVVGVGDTIHFISHYLRELKRSDDQHAAIVCTLKRTGLPMLFTTITTAISLLSFNFAGLVPVASLGLYAATGIVLAYIYTIFMLPALLTLFPIQSKLRQSKRYEGMIRNSDRFFDQLAAFVVRRSLAIVLSGVILLITAIILATQLSFSYNPLSWLPEDSRTKKTYEVIERQIGGVIPIDIIIDTGEFEGAKKADFLSALNQFVYKAEAFSTDALAAKRSVSISDVIKEVNQALFANDTKHYAIPDNNSLIAQEFLMLESSGLDDLFALVDTDYQKVHLTLYTRWADALDFVPYADGLQALADSHFQGMAQVEVNGMVALLSRILEQIMLSTATSYLIAIIVISLTMILLLGSLKYGLISMLPNIMPIAIALAVMRIMDAPLDLFTMLIGSIAIGIAVDDTVHFLHGFKREFESTRDVEQAIANTFHSTGRAMMSTTIVLCLGFLVYMFSSMSNLQDFGLYTAICIFVALLADFLFVPALMVLLERYSNKSEAVRN